MLNFKTELEVHLKEERKENKRNFPLKIPAHNRFLSVCGNITISMGQWN